jgi:hypothetical protein
MRPPQLGVAQDLQRLGCRCHNDSWQRPTHKRCRRRCRRCNARVHYSNRRRRRAVVAEAVVVVGVVNCPRPTFPTKTTTKIPNRRRLVPRGLPRAVPPLAVRTQRVTAAAGALLLAINRKRPCGKLWTRRAWRSSPPRNARTKRPWLSCHPQRHRVHNNNDCCAIPTWRTVSCCTVPLSCTAPIADFLSFCPPSLVPRLPSCAPPWTRRRLMQRPVRTTIRN